MFDHFEMNAKGAAAPGEIPGEIQAEK